MRKIILVNLIFLMMLIYLFTGGVSARKLEVWVGNSQEQIWMKKAVAAYENKTGIKIDLNVICELEQLEKLRLEEVAGNNIDVVGWPHDDIGKAVSEGLLTPIQEYISTKYIKDNFTDKSIRALSYQDKIYGLPYSYEALALVYNKDKYNEIPDTMEEFIELAKTKTDLQQQQYGFLFYHTNFYYAAPFLLGHGAYVFGKNEDGSYNINDIGFNNEGGIAGAKLIKKFKDEGVVPQNIQKKQVVHLFAEGKAGAVLVGPWRRNRFKEAGIDFAVSPIPKLSNGKSPKPFVGVKGYYIPHKSDNKKLAADFIKFITNAKWSMKHYEMIGSIVPHKRVINSPKIKNDEFSRGFLIQAQNGILMPNVLQMSVVWNPVNKALDFLLDGRISAKKAMALTDKMITRNIELIGY
ncbi:extracellular solute-binding protein [Halanaerobacter jeridensis]|uniref:Arabinogalactan oligomer/maltooligosaccharide transport system substrate-binding protein n=1 Tax=Halanaerobacter jeridensis TaxID=706427 RepID=A0A938XRK0_9FIRM|nr:extracellular solute-binding protein [Halanaerobacter jeridensis]MBM7555499.1 arabinogalactan oligomer/maltooligosaccharide transport system substrate-binding protein [Halanaerobacter jeridensis]